MFLHQSSFRVSAFLLNILRGERTTQASFQQLGEINANTCLQWDSLWYPEHFLPSIWKIPRSMYCGFFLCKEMQMVTISCMISSESFEVLFSLYLKVSIPALQIQKPRKHGLVSSLSSVKHRPPCLRPLLSLKAQEKLMAF